MKTNSFILTASYELKGLDDHLVYKDEFVRCYLKSENSNHIKLIENESGIILYVGEKYNPSLNSESFAGTIIEYKKEENRIIVSADTLGTSIIFYEASESSFIVSNRLENLTKASQEVDWNSIQQYLNTGYTIDRTTFFKSIEQTLPLERIEFLCKGGILKKSPSGKNSSILEAECIESICEELITSITTRGSSILMASAGWDSRTLLAGGSDIYGAAYSHGDLESRELRLTSEIIKSLGLKHVKRGLEGLSLGVDTIEEMLEQLGYCIFPIWYRAAEHINKEYGLPLSSGVLGEQLGGHYGIASVGTRAEKFRSLIRSMYSNSLNEKYINTLQSKLTRPYSKHWFLSDEGNTHFRDLADSTQEVASQSLSNDLEKYGDWQSAFERFNMRHRARQYILKQAQASSSLSGYIIPFGDSRLADLVYRIPFKDRVHNKLNKKVLERLSPELLGYSMAATLVKASNPIILQELSRVLRIVKENIRKNFSARREQLGWFNYDYLNKSTLLHDLVDGLSNPIWDKERMYKSINAQVANGIDPGHTLDMICKIRTVDYYINNTSRKLS